MRSAYVIEITTPKKFLLNGLWFGPTRPKRVIIWVHGLSSSAFSMKHVVTKLIDSRTAVITFNNRGYGVVNKLHSSFENKKPRIAGAAHEIFTECVDDIDGAIRFVRKNKVKNIYLAGHSTGCQKVAYWASRRNGGRSVKGIILAAPVSDYAAGRKLDTGGKLARGIALARKLIKQGKKHTLMPAHTLTTWSIDDAQRFVSLYTPDSVEEIFSYSQPKKTPIVLHKARVPILALWAENDRYSDRSPQEIGEWFKDHLHHARSAFRVIRNANHSFWHVEGQVKSAINQWISR